MIKLNLQIEGPTVCIGRDELLLVTGAVNRIRDQVPSDFSFLYLMTKFRRFSPKRLRYTV